MRPFLHLMSSLWFATMAPVLTPLTTIEAREGMRKRCLLSVILFINFVTMLSFMLISIFFGKYGIEMELNVFCLVTIALTFLLNRYGYLKCAAIFYLLTTFLEIAGIVSILTLDIPILLISCWPIFFVLPVEAGLFLPFWGPLLMAFCEVGFMGWFLLVERESPFALYMKIPTEQLMFVFAIGLFMICIALFSAIATAMTKRAVLQADHTIELEQANHALTVAYTQLETTHDTIQKQALTDGLTNLPNHRAIMSQLEKELNRARRYGRSFSLLFFDADRFKRVNDTYGHAAGDAVLRQIGEQASNVLREGDTLGRFGGEEFIILLLEANAHEASVVAERVRAIIASEPVAKAEVADGLSITVSIGLSTFPDDGNTGQELLSQADEAMYMAKRLGRNQVRTAEEVRHMSTDLELMALLQREGQREAAQREEIVPEQLRETYTVRMISSLLSLLEGRDENLSAHAHEVSDLSTRIAQALQMPLAQISRIGMAALLHDIGKVGVPDTLLQKNGALSSHERTLLQDHAELGASILEGSPFLYDLMPAVRHHHEYWDGSGYPEHLAGEDIPLAARIIAVAEAYDAMQRDYPYQKRRSPEEALAELQRCAGTQFDPIVVKVLSTLLTDQSLSPTENLLQQVG